MGHPALRGNVPDDPRAPAAAYHLMMSLIPESFWTEPFPSGGDGWQTIEVTSTSDNVKTQWCLPSGLVAALVGHLRPRSDVRIHFP